MGHIQVFGTTINYIIIENSSFNNIWEQKASGLTIAHLYYEAIVEIVEILFNHP